MKKLYTLIMVAGLALTGMTLGEEPASPADNLWQKIQVMERQGPEEEAPSLAERKSAILGFLRQLDGLLDDFIRQYPTDRRVWEARLDKLQIASDRATIEGQPLNVPAVETGVKEIVGAEGASKLVKAQASFFQLQAHAKVLIDDPQPGKLPAFDKEITTFTAEYPYDQNNRELPQLRIAVYEKVEPAKAEALLKELVADTKNPQLAIAARAQLKARELTTKPLELKFTALDGTEFDLTKWRGKVVLVDFWATWCGPCRMELPHVLDAYKKLHEKGFEIVGVSLDKDKEHLLAFTKEKGMTWPQYFDGKVWENKISTNYGITGIPTMWLVDKKGFVRSTEARADLEDAVTKLLME